MQRNVRSGADRDTLFHFLGMRIAQDVSPPPNGFDVIFAIRGLAEFLAQLADEDIDDFSINMSYAKDRF